MRRWTNHVAICCLLAGIIEIGAAPRHSEVPQTVKDILRQYRIESARIQNIQLPENYSFDDENDGMFQKDMILSERQARMLLEELRSDGVRSESRSKRAVVINSKLWGRTIPYSVAEMPDGETLNIIHAGMRHWQEHTCLKFEEITSNKVDHLHFYAGENCASHVGLQSKGGQEISIGNGCEYLGTVVHEIGHALGLWHEQSHPIRGDYVLINRHHIRPEPDILKNFNITQHSKVVDHGLPYDFGSIMHYKATDFSINEAAGLRTIESFDPRYNNTMGQERGLSFLDAKAINMLYCSDVCKGRGPICHKGGYRDPKNCNECICPFGLAGNCEEPAPSTNNCGGNLVATESWKTLRIIRGGQNQDCNWMIKSLDDSKIEAKVLHLDYACEVTCNSWLEVKGEGGFEKTGPRMCCPKTEGATFQSDSDTIVVIHRTYDSHSRRGFSLRYRAAGREESKNVTKVPVTSVKTSTTTSTTSSPITPTTTTSTTSSPTTPTTTTSTTSSPTTPTTTTSTTSSPTTPTTTTSTTSSPTTPTTTTSTTSSPTTPTTTTSTTSSPTIPTTTTSTTSSPTTPTTTTSTTSSPTTPTTTTSTTSSPTTPTTTTSTTSSTPTTTTRKPCSSSTSKTTTRKPCSSSTPKTTTITTSSPPSTSIIGSGNWGSWSECSASCGGCGSRSRSKYHSGWDRLRVHEQHEITTCKLDACRPTQWDLDRCQKSRFVRCWRDGRWRSYRQLTWVRRCGGFEMTADGKCCSGYRDNQGKCVKDNSYYGRYEYCYYVY